MSRFLYPFERRVLLRRRIAWWVGATAGFIVLWLMDGVLYRWLSVTAGHDREEAQQRISLLEDYSWVQALRTMGYVPAWIAVGVVLALIGRGLDGVRIAASAALGGALAEVLKPLVGLVRPKFTEGVHHFRHTPGLSEDQISYGMASSHMGVAMGAAVAIAYLYGRAGLVPLAAAAGCGLVRMMAGAHFASDVYVAAILGYAAARLLRPGGWAGKSEGLLLP